MVAVLHVEGSPAGQRWLWCLGSHIPQRFCLGWLLPPSAAQSRNVVQGKPSPHSDLTGPGSPPHPSHEGRSGAATFLPRALGPGRKGSHSHPSRDSNLCPASPEDAQCRGLGSPKGWFGPNCSWVGMVLPLPQNSEVTSEGGLKAGSCGVAGGWVGLSTRGQGPLSCLTRGCP